MEQKDLSLLRPFDLEAAKAGAGVLWFETDARWLAISANYPDGPKNIVEHVSGLSYVSDDELRMAPLCWVEGRPVYKGDALWHRSYGRVEIVCTDARRAVFIVGRAGSSQFFISAENLTWTPPMVKRQGWVNIYEPSQPCQVACTSNAWESESAANKISQEGRIACVRVEWEEPAKGGAA